MNPLHIHRSKRLPRQSLLGHPTFLEYHYQIPLVTTYHISTTLLLTVYLHLMVTMIDHNTTATKKYPNLPLRLLRRPLHRLYLRPFPNSANEH